MKHTRLKLALIATALVSIGASATEPGTDSTGVWNGSHAEMLNSATGVANLSISKDVAPLTVETTASNSLTTSTSKGTLVATFTVNNSETDTSVCFASPTVSGANSGSTFTAKIASGAGSATSFSPSANSCANDAEKAVLTVYSPTDSALSAGYTQISATATTYKK